MSCFITLEQDLKELNYYDDIIKLSEVSNAILKNGIEHLYEEKVLEVTLENVEQKIELLPEKSKRGLSVHAVKFFDEESKRKRLVYVYSSCEELKAYGFKFESKGKSVYKYTIDMKEENDKIYLEKKLFFDKKKAIEEIVKVTDRKNVIFLRYKGELYAMKIEIAQFIYEKIEEDLNFDIKKHLSSTINFQYYFYIRLFRNNKNYTFLLTKKLNDERAKYLITIENNKIMIIGGVELYITPELYARNKSIFKNVNEIPAVNVTDSLLNKFRTQLNDPDFSISKIFGFKNYFYYSRGTVSYTDFVIPDFNAFIKIKSPKEVNLVFKNTL